jgi:hypothetical protein
MDSFLDLAQRVRTHLCYAHVFGDALTEQQIVARCAPDDPEGVRRELAVLEATANIMQDGGYWFLYGEKPQDFASARESRKRAAQRVLESPRKLIWFLKRTGVVSMLAVSGSVGWKNCVERTGKPVDLDLFVITAPAGVHIVRFVVHVREVLRWLLSRLGLGANWVRMCPNYVTEVEFLEITNRSFYTASDALHVEVLKGQDVYHRFLSANPWIGRYYPVPATVPQSSFRLGRSRLRAALNIACFATLAASARIKSLMLRRAFSYSLGFRFDRANSLKRSAPEGGGHQPVVARRFRDVHTRHFGPDPSLFAFLFPDTTGTGVYANGEYAEPHAWSALGYDE